MGYWDTQKQIDKKINALVRKVHNTKKRLSKTKSKNIVENFGQSYVWKFNDELNKIDATFSSKQRADKVIRDFDDWVSRFGGI